MAKVTIDREECIICGACWSVCPEFFEEAEEDGLSAVVEEYRVDEDMATGEAPDEHQECVEDAAADCPVEIIHVES